MRDSGKCDSYCTGHATSGYSFCSMLAHSPKAKNQQTLFPQCCFPFSCSLSQAHVIEQVSIVSFPLSHTSLSQTPLISPNSLFGLYCTPRQVLYQQLAPPASQTKILPPITILVPRLRHAYPNFARLVPSLPAQPRPAATKAVGCLSRVAVDWPPAL